MSIAFLLFLSVVLNVIYLYSAKLLMGELSNKAEKYWANIGGPESFSVRDGSYLLANLYTAGMTNACLEGGFIRLLKRVRVLLPLTFFVTGFSLLILSFVINS